MPLTTRQQIKERILDEMEYIEEAPYAVDYIEELADSECPVYYSEILTEWAELSPDDSNQFGEIMTPDSNTTIYNLMSVDLWLYYRREFLAVYNEILDEQERGQN